MLRKEYLGLTVLAFLALYPALAQAQFGQGLAELAMSQGGAKQGISVTGTATVERKPTHLRMVMQLQATGKTLPDALAKLKERREAATTQLETLKADKKSIVFGAPNTSNVQSARKRQIEAMVMAQMRARGKKTPKGLQTPRTVTVTATLTAQWPLSEAESLEQMLVTAQGIQDKIKAADLAGAKEEKTVSAEEEEFAEEAAQMANQYGREEEEQPGEAHFMYAASLSKADREKAMAKAFQKAGQQANDMAKAAGVPCGPLVALSGACSGQGDIGENNYMGYDPSGSSNMLRRMLAQQAGENSEAELDEAMSANPCMLRFSCIATAVFQIGTGK